MPAHEQCNNTDTWSEPNTYETAILISIKFTGQSTELTGTTQKAVVGQQISLTASYSGSSGQNSWSVPGTTVSGYSPSSSSAAQPGTPTFTNQGTSFYWVDSSSSARAVTFTLTPSQGNPATGTVMFTVEGPTNVNVTSPTGTVNIANNAVMQLGGSTANEGITFSQSATGPTDFPGEYTWVQLVNTTTTSSPATGNPITCSGSGLDSDYPYSTTSPFSDNPRASLDSRFVEVSLSDSFQMFLMWAPIVSGPSIPVPLGSVSWSWSGDSVLNTTSGIWSLQSSAKTTNGFIQSTSFPTWTTPVVGATGQGVTCN